MRKKFLIDFGIPVLLLMAITLLFRLLNLDLRIQRLFFDPLGGWFLKHSQPWDLLYRYSNIPALIVSVGSLILLTAGFYIYQLTRYRKILFYFVCIMAIGPGLIINTILKDNWGRPRPRNITEFGGKYDFEEVLQIDPSSPGKSLPCGHASMGFYFMAPSFIFRKKRKTLANIFLFFGLIFGSLIGLARIVQGGHFASDVIWSAGIVFLVSAGFSHLLHLEDKMFTFPTPAWQKFKRVAIPILIASTLILMVLLLSSAPFEMQKIYDLTSFEKINTIRLETKRGEVQFIEAENLSLEISTNGHGMPGSKINCDFQVQNSNLIIVIKELGLFNEMDIKISFYLPTDSNIQISAKIGKKQIQYPDLR